MVYLYAFVLLNLLTFLITAYDKRLAVAHKRISEDPLFAAVGGTIGSALAMYLLDIKLQKYYLFKFYRIVILQIIGIGYFIFMKNCFIKKTD
jgi:uncharacterized membrane protein YsdA (DUF1294 family)